MMNINHYLMISTAYTTVLVVQNHLSFLLLLVMNILLLLTS